ncbi:hypothetical protein HO133_009018 [Letharia lupina]|uniref:Uncharacterized protein n=1 Tax=Letharia lupina TaxID=560253 RepID=A0A8H6CMK0_9LECA|nr:uncharacterized protein HO133_009018 [Letharia lupina]KAF6226152.1 hypothetical protein HO133_009018 [Letharia lupina]
MRHVLTLFSILLAFSAFGNASRFAPAQRSRFGPRKSCPATYTSETIDGEQHCVAPRAEDYRREIVNGVPPEGVRPNPSRNPAQQSAVAAERATVSATDAIVISQNNQGISAGAVVPANPDPCGPPTGQAPGVAGSLSTCHANVSVADLAQPSYYGVQCTNDNSGFTLEQGTCLDSLLTENPTDGEDINRLPKGGAPPPSDGRCQEQITSVISQSCAGPVFNAGGVNVKEFPSAGASNTSSTGLPVDPMYPSYVMMPFKSYCGINVMDDC